MCARAGDAALVTWGKPPCRSYAARPSHTSTGTATQFSRSRLRIRTRVIGSVISSVIGCGTGRAVLYSRINGSGSAPTARAMMRMYPRA